MPVAQRFMTVQRYIIEQERMHPEATGELSKLLSDLIIAGKVISREVNKAGLADILGYTGGTNVHGDNVKKLDIFSHEIIFKAMDHGGHLCVMASEEQEGIISIPENFKLGKYVLLFDPLDGSSNIEVNASIGTIFSIYKRVSEGSGPGTEKDCLQPGIKQVAAGYILYGSSTVLVYTAGHGVHEFTLDPSIGEFILSEENIQIPAKGKIYSINEGNYLRWHPGVKKFIKYLQQEESTTGRPYSARYSGTMVSDVHRILHYGGIFMYPTDTRHPEGKLRLLYEANPMAAIIEAAGGMASNGRDRIMEIEPKALHQNVPFFIGSKEDVKLANDFIASEKVGAV